MSLKKACRSATVVHARILILASEAPAQISARWDEWILLTLREQEGVFFSFVRSFVPDLAPTSNLFLPRVTFDDSLM